MKTLFTLIIIAAVVYFGIKLSIPKPDQTIPSATETTTGTPTETTPDTTSPTTSSDVPAGNISIAFSGYGPGKQHDGTVAVKSSTLKNDNGTFSGGIVIDMNAITSSPAQMVSHLKTDAFFDTAKYPTATFAITSSTKSEIKGNLTLKGVSKAVTLPVTYDATAKTYTSTVRINMELFGIKQTFADKEFVVKVTIK